MAIYHRDTFLKHLSQRLGRPMPAKPAPLVLPFDTEHQVLAGASQEELLTVLFNYSDKTLGVRVEKASKATLAEVLKKVCQDYVGDTKKETILSADKRLLDSLSAEDLASERLPVYLWQSDETQADENLRHVEAAKVGIVYAEQALAESGTVVLESRPTQGRMISLLPEASVFVIPKSGLVARVTQAMERLHAQVEDGKRVASCVNLISGPSSTADIELTKVVGVHGPMEACYVVLEDA